MDGSLDAATALAAMQKSFQEQMEIQKMITKNVGSTADVLRKTGDGCLAEIKESEKIVNGEVSKSHVLNKLGQTAKIWKYHYEASQSLLYDEFDILNEDYDEALSLLNGPSAKVHKKLMKKRKIEALTTVLSHAQEHVTIWKFLYKSLSYLKKLTPESEQFKSSAKRLLEEVLSIYDYYSISLRSQIQQLYPDIKPNIDLLGIFTDGSMITYTETAEMCMKMANAQFEYVLALYLESNDNERLKSLSIVDIHLKHYLQDDDFWVVADEKLIRGVDKVQQVHSMVKLLIPLVQSLGFSNIQALERSPSPHFEKIRDAIESVGQTVRGLDKIPLPHIMYDVPQAYQQAFQKASNENIFKELLDVQTILLQIGQSIQAEIIEIDANGDMEEFQDIIPSDINTAASDINTAASDINTAASDINIADTSNPGKGSSDQSTSSSSKIQRKPVSKQKKEEAASLRKKHLEILNDKNVSFKSISSLLARLGFKIENVVGSHIVYGKNTFKMTVVRPHGRHGSTMSPRNMKLIIRKLEELKEI